MKYQIEIPKPCNENWNKMTPLEKGRHCKSCDKEVIDFTKMTNSEVSKKVLTQKNLCGRFNQLQLKTEIEIVKKNDFSKIAASIALVATIGVSEPVFSLSKKDSMAILNLKTEKVFLENDSINKYIIIKGIVKDRLEGLPGVSIVLKGTQIGAETDFDGNFSIKIPNKKRNSHILVFSYLGYKQQEMDVLSIKKPLIIKLEEDNTVLGGIEITLGMVEVVKKPTIFKRVGNFFRKKENRRN